MQLHRFSLAAGATAGALVMLLATTFGAAASPTAAQQAPLDQQVADLRADLQKTQLLAVAYQLNTSGFHDLDVKLNQGEMVFGALGRVQQARIAVQATNWPGELRPTVDQIVAQMKLLESALRDENVEAAKGPAKQVHDLGHDLSHAAYAALEDHAAGEHPEGH